MDRPDCPDCGGAMIRTEAGEHTELFVCRRACGGAVVVDRGCEACLCGSRESS